MGLQFRANEKNLTLGVEMELQVLDAETLLLTPRAAEFLQEINNPKLAKEMFRSTLEIVTGICDNVTDVISDFEETLVDVKKYAEENGIRFAATGTNPISDYSERIISVGSRYNELLDRNQWLIRRMAVYGLHVHIGMHDGESCMRFTHFFLRFVPHLIAISASSPYWRKEDTGLASARPTMYEAHPTSGIPYLAKDWNDFDRVYHEMLATQSIKSIKDIWWDIRPSPGYGTMELRMCDGLATMLELECIVAFIHLLAHWFEKNGENIFSTHNAIPDRWILRENKWRAIRHGTQASIIDPDTMVVTSIEEAINKWLINLEPFIKQLNYETQVFALKKIISKGNSSVRQRREMAKHGNLEKLVEHNINEWERGIPIW